MLNTKYIGSCYMHRRQKIGADNNGKNNYHSFEQRKIYEQPRLGSNLYWPNLAHRYSVYVFYYRCLRYVYSYRPLGNHLIHDHIRLMLIGVP